MGSLVPSSSPASVKRHRAQPTTILTHDEYRGLRYFKSLDALRAISLAMIFLRHNSWFPADRSYGFESSVSLFFVISGFLITTLLIREAQRYGHVSLSKFYVRRLFRIYPMFISVFVLYILLVSSGIMDPQRWAQFSQQIPYIVMFLPEHTFFSPGPFFSHGAQILPPFTISWTIGIEEKFYFVWPLLGFVLLKAKPKRQVVALIIAAVVCISAMFWHDGPGLYVAPYQQIAFGAAVALLLHSAKWYERCKWLGRGPVLLGLVIAQMAFVGIFDPRPTQPNLSYTVSGLLYAAILCGLVVGRPRGTAWLSSRPMVLMGEISFVTYLTHRLVINVWEKAAGKIVPHVLPNLPAVAIYAMTAIGAYITTMVVGYVIHRVFEDPIRKYGSRLAQRIPRKDSDTDKVSVPA